MKMKLYGDTNETLAKAIKISPQRLCAKINRTGGEQFRSDEIEKIARRYALTDIEVCRIFFADWCRSETLVGGMQLQGA
jgi:hypothetical protein